MDPIRTTVRLDPALMRAVKRFAAQNGRTFTSVIEDALREVIARATAPANPGRRFRLPTFGHGGAWPGVDLDRPSSLLDREDVERFERGRKK